MKRTAFVGSVAALSLAGMLPVRGEAIDMVAFHCGSDHDCCSNWAAKARLHGYNVTLYNVTDDARVEKFRIPRSLLSCHTAVAGDYVFEGHVPFDVVDRILAERPAIRGVAIPGMPLGLPGLEGRWPERIEVFVIDDPKKIYVTLPATA
jgi:hypothetical protein